MTDDRPDEPTSPHLDELLAAAGIDGHDIDVAREHMQLPLLALEHMVLPHAGVHNLAELSTVTGLEPAMISRVWRSLGFAEPGPDDRIFSEVDAEMLGAVVLLQQMEIIDAELTLQMSRVIGSSMARVALAVIDAVDPDDEQTDPAEPVEGADGAEGSESAAGPDPAEGSTEASTEVDESLFISAAPLVLPTLVKVIEMVWRRHMQVAARARMEQELAGPERGHQVVGFADLVGFTALSQQIGSHQLAEVVDRFETIAYDTVSAGGGRVVKMIGDEVMFSVPDAAAAVEIALGLSAGYRDDDELSDVRVGLAAGSVLQREADLFGPVVNRASRIVNIAFPGSVVCDDVIHEALADSTDLAWRPLGARRLKDIGRVSLFVVRRAEAPERQRSTRERAEAIRSERREAGVAALDRVRKRRGDRP